MPSTAFMGRDGRRSESDRGSAVVDFALVGGLLTLLFAAVLQLGIALYVHNMLVSCAAEGARSAARADRAPADAVAQTRELVTQTLSASYARDITADTELVGGVRVVVVRVRAPLPLFGLFGPSRVMQATGHAFAESQ
jgi:Flp pilus assembly protein TadG